MTAQPMSLPPTVGALAELLRVGCWRVPDEGRNAGATGGGYLHLRARVEGGLPELLEEVHPDDRRGFATAAEWAARTGAGLVHAFRSAGRPTKFLRIATAVREVGGILMLPEGYLVDETAQVLAEARLATITETTPAMLWVMEPDGFCSFFSRSWYDYTGQAPEEALGLGWLQKVHPEDIGMAAECAARAVQLKTHFRIEHRLRHRDGSWRWVLCVGNPRFDEHDRFLGHSGAVTDIHDRRLSEQRQRENEPGPDDPGPDNLLQFPETRSRLHRVTPKA